MIGLLIATYDFVEILAKPAFGALADRQCTKKTMLAGILEWTALDNSLLGHCAELQRQRQGLDSASAEG